MTKRRTAAEIIATHLGYDLAEMSDYRYQPTSYHSPALYTIGDYYFCAPRKGQRCSKTWNWHLVGRYYERDVFRAHMNDDLKER